MQRIRLLFVLKNAVFFRSRFLDELAKEFELTVIFTMRANETRGREPAYFREQVDAAYRRVYVRGISFGKFKVATSLPPEAKERYDCVVVGLLDDVVALQFMEYCRWTGRRYLLSLDGVGRRGFFLDLLFGRYIRGATACLSPGLRTDEFVAELSSRTLPVRRYTLSSVLAEDVDEHPLGSLEKSCLRQSLGVRGSRPVILGVGQLIHRKGIDVLVRAMALVSRPCTVILVGGQPDRDLEELVGRGVDQHSYSFVDYLPPKALADYYRMADLFVLPTRGDSWGLVVVEAMTHGLPVITTTACGAGVELVDDAVGVLVKPDDVWGLSNAITRLLDDPDELVARSCASLEKARNFTIETMSGVCAHVVREFASAPMAE